MPTPAGYTTASERARMRYLYGLGLSTEEVAELTGFSARTVCDHVDTRSLSEAGRLARRKRWWPLALKAGRLHVAGHSTSVVAGMIGRSESTTYWYIRRYYETLGVEGWQRQGQRPAQIAFRQAA